MKCPKCKEGEIEKEISLKGFFKKRKIITYHCPLCDFRNVQEFKISCRNHKFEEMKREKEIDKQFIMKHEVKK